MEGSLLATYPLFLFPSEKLKSFIEKVFPDLTNYKENRSIHYICFEWKGKKIKFFLDQDGIHSSSKKTSNFINLLIWKQFRIDDLEEMLMKN